MERYGKCCYCQHKRTNGLADSYICELDIKPIFNGKKACENFKPRFDLENVHFELGSEIIKLNEAIENNENTGYAVNALKNKQYLEWLVKLSRVLSKLESDIEED